MGKTRCLIFSGFVLLLVLCPAYLSVSSSAQAGDVSPSGASFQLQPVLSGLSSPVHVTNAADGTNRLFVIEQGGTIRVAQPGATTHSLFLDITTRVGCAPGCGERGLLGLAFHPYYENNGRFFVYYTRAADGALQIAEYHVSAANPNMADTTEIPILTIPHPGQANHNGGTIAFGPDGYLYSAPGDGGGGNDVPNNAQNINELLGKVLRIDIDHGNGPVPYSSPATNPFFGSTPGRDEIYAVGMRNPYRFSFDRGGTGQLYVGDVGQGAWEEIDIITLGGNYGWRVFEGAHCSGNDPGLCNSGSACNINGYTCPIAEYSSLNPNPRCAITGGYVYRGPAGTLPTGAYVFADFCTGEILMLQGMTQTSVIDTTLNISSFGEDEAGEIYVVGLGGVVQRLTNADAACSFSILPASQSYPANGGAGAVQVTTAVSCPWNAMSNDSWIVITSGSSGTGVGAVSYQVSPNTAASLRTGTMIIAGQTFTVAQGAAFLDVSPSDMFYREIGKLSARGVTLGCGGGSYCQAGPVTREQMAAFIIRALGEFSPPLPGMQRFVDVPPSNVFYNFIDRLAELEITLGCGGGNYCPNDPVTREQMAAFLMRALGEFDPPPPPSQRYVDVPPTNIFYNFIDRMAIRGITLGCSGNSYCPGGMVTRNQMAAFLVRAFNL